MEQFQLDLPEWLSEFRHVPYHVQRQVATFISFYPNSYKEGYLADVPQQT